jgi:outer membrane lipoprotein LolB
VIFKDIFAKILVIFASLIIAGCANYSTALKHEDSKENNLTRKFPVKTEFRGRLSLKIDADSAQNQTQPQFFSGAFELIGNVQNGTLVLYSPLGNTVAALNWSPGVAQLESSGATRQFDSLGAMVQSATGADLPIDSLFSWLNGNPAQAPGWMADLSGADNGRVTARRVSPTPPVELRIILD